MADNNVGALAGLRVLDLGRVLAAPWTGQILADLGADVIKVERPGHGDEARTYGLAMKSVDGRPTPASMHLVANRNKRSITIDFAKQEGRELVRDLAAKSDVLIENFLPGVLRKFDLDYEALSAGNPRLIFCSLTGYGQTGPYSKRPGYDAVFQAHGGLMSVTGLPDDVPGGGPMKTGPSLVDVSTGFVAAIGILAALASRATTGNGQHVDASLLDTVVALQSSLIQGFLVSREQPQRKGTDGNGGHPARVFSCVDGDIYISAGHQQHYESLCHVLKLEYLIGDPRFADNRLRFSNRAHWNGVAVPVIAAWKKNDLLAALVAAKVPASLVNDYAEVFADPQVIHRGIEVKLPNPLDPTHQISMAASPIRLSKTPVQYNRPPPNLGEHTDEVLRDVLGKSDEEISVLRERNVI